MIAPGVISGSKNMHMPGGFNLIQRHAALVQYIRRRRRDGFGASRGGFFAVMRDQLVSGHRYGAAHGLGIARGNNNLVLLLPLDTLRRGDLNRLRCRPRRAAKVETLRARWHCHHRTQNQTCTKGPEFHYCACVSVIAAGPLKVISVPRFVSTKPLAAFSVPKGPCTCTGSVLLALPACRSI